MVLLHSGLLSGGGLRVVLLVVLPLYSSSSGYPQGGLRCSYNIGSHGCKHLFTLSQPAQWEFLSSVLTKSSHPLGQKLEPSWCCYLCLSQVFAVVAYLVVPSVALTVLWDRQQHALNPYATPWESCCLTWTVKMLCILLQFSSFIVVWQRLLMHKSRSVCNLSVFKAGRMHQGMTGCVHVCTSSPLKLLKLVYVIKKDTGYSYGWVLYGWKEFVFTLWKLRAQSYTVYLVFRMLLEAFSR